MQIFQSYTKQKNSLVKIELGNSDTQLQKQNYNLNIWAIKVDICLVRLHFVNFYMSNWTLYT